MQLFIRKKVDPLVLVPRVAKAVKTWRTLDGEAGGASEGGGGATDRGTYVELVYELLQDTWGNILQQTISPMRQACRTQQDADSCTVGQV